MSEEETLLFNILIDVEKPATQMRQLYALVSRVLTLMKRLGLPPDIEEAIRVAQRLISTANTLRVSLLALETASGPLGWTLAIVGIMAAGSVSLQDEFGSYG